MTLPAHKFRCSRCRRTLHVSRRAGRYARFCRLCSRRSRPCSRCAGLPHRVIGPTCYACGLAFAPDVVRIVEPTAQSGLSRCAEGA
jgi:hypothetical protein